MNSDLKIIKKYYGEKMMHLCREFFPIILEKEGLLSKLMLDNFEPSHDLYQDLIDNNLESNFKNFIYSLINVEKKEVTINKTPKELMSEAGYNLYECLTEEDIQNFKKYYAPGEALCTFNGGRLKTARVFFAIKKNVDEIKREDYKEPKRQDEYGTSVISIQFSLDGSNTLSIKNRYNHRVNNPDATFSNNLDNIINGLTKSFEEYYGIVQKHKNNGFEIPSYVIASDGKYYKYNYEINNIYYCPNNIIIDNFEVKRYAKEKYLIMDYFILDLENKKISLYPNYNYPDSFIDGLKDIERIEVKKEDNGKIIYLTPKVGEIIEIGLDNQNRIINYENSNLEYIGDDFLNYNETLISLNLPNVKKIEDFFLYKNETLTNIDLSNVKNIGNSFLYCNEILTRLNLPNVEYIGNRFLFYNNYLKSINLPKVKKIGDSFLFYNDVLYNLNLPIIEEIGEGFLHYNPDFKIYELKESYSRRRIL